MTLWPVAGHAPGPRRAACPAAAGRLELRALSRSCLVLWFTAELYHGNELGLAERAVTADQSLWPLIVVASVLLTQRRPVAAAEPTAALRSR